MFELIVSVLAFMLLVVALRWGQIAHFRRLPAYRIRVHVNGIRGKSTVTRLVAGVLRESGIRTLAKTTGSAPMTVDLSGQDHEIQRRGVPNVREQLDVIAQWQPFGAEAIVMECMALDPRNQRWLERKVMHAHIGIITNVREDHQDLMGESLALVCESLAAMCPTNGVLITAEADPALQDIMRRAAEARNSRLVIARPERVSDAEVARFDYLAFKDNIAIGLAVADLHGIDRETAMRGMLKAPPDAGAVFLRSRVVRGRRLLWANLFAVNDRESAILSVDRLAPCCDAHTVRIGILNNRHYRERRAEEFSQIAVRDLEFDWLVTFGAYEGLVSRTLVRHGFPPGRIVHLGFSVNPSLGQIVDGIVGLIPEGHTGLLVGLANIHTPQAEMLMAYLEELPSEPLIAESDLAEETWPLTVERQRLAAG